MRLTNVERLLLLNQYRILAILQPGEREHERAMEILRRGYEYEYRSLSGFPSDEEDMFLSEEECKTVRDVMTMFWELQTSFDSLSDTTGIDSQSLVFRGFDGNNETMHMAYARFLSKIEGNFESLRHTPDFNSHCPSLVRYEAMLERWEDCENKYDLSADDIVRILGR